MADALSPCGGCASSATNEALAERAAPSSSGSTAARIDPHAGMGPLAPAAYPAPLESSPGADAGETRMLEADATVVLHLRRVPRVQGRSTSCSRGSAGLTADGSAARSREALRASAALGARDPCGRRRRSQGRPARPAGSRREEVRELSCRACRRRRVSDAGTAWTSGALVLALNLGLNRRSSQGMPGIRFA